MARLILIAEELRDSETADFIRGNLKNVIDVWLLSNNSNPLMFDTTWKGICSSKGMDSPNNDFGQGWYNDHRKGFRPHSESSFQQISTMDTLCMRLPFSERVTGIGSRRGRKRSLPLLGTIQ